MAARERDTRHIESPRIREGPKAAARTRACDTRAQKKIARRCEKDTMPTCYQLLYLALICGLLYHVSVLCGCVEVATGGGADGRSATRLRRRGHPSPFPREGRRERWGRRTTSRKSGSLQAAVGPKVNLGDRRRLGVCSVCSLRERIADAGNGEAEREDHSKTDRERAREESHRAGGGAGRQRP